MVRRLRLKTSSKTIKKVSLRAEIMRLRTEGDSYGRRMSYAQIAQTLGCSTGTVYNAVKDALDDLRAETHDYADIVRQKDVDTCDRIIFLMMRKVEEEQDTQAAGTALKAIERKAKLLGTNAPERTEHTHTAGAIPITAYASLENEALLKLLKQKQEILAAELGESQTIDCEFEGDCNVSDTNEDSALMLPEHTGGQLSKEVVEEELGRISDMVDE